MPSACAACITLPRASCHRLADQRDLHVAQRHARCDRTPRSGRGSWGRACSRRPDHKRHFHRRLRRAMRQVEQHAPRAGRTARCNAGRRTGRCPVAAPSGGRDVAAVPPSRPRPGRPGRRHRRPAARPGQLSAQQQAVRPRQRQRVLDAACRLRHQVLEFGPLGGVDAGQVQHADATAIGAEQRRAGAAVHAGVVEEMFAAVQPDRLQFGQRGADGGGADAAFGQVDADAGDQRRHGGRCGRSGRGRRRPRLPGRSGWRSSGCWRSPAELVEHRAARPAPTLVGFARSRCARLRGDHVEATAVARAAGRWPGNGARSARSSGLRTRYRPAHRWRRGLRP